MSIKEYLAGAKMSGSVQKLMTPGLAVEFIQPWYTPLSTTPSTTGNRFYVYSNASRHDSRDERDAGRPGSHRKGI